MIHRGMFFLVFAGLLVLIGVVSLAITRNPVAAQTYCLAPITLNKESIALPLVIGHTTPKLEGIHEGDASLGVEYMAEAGIPELLAEELKTREEVLFTYMLPTVLVGTLLSNFEYADAPLFSDETIFITDNGSNGELIEIDEFVELTDAIQGEESNEFNDAIEEALDFWQDTFSTQFLLPDLEKLSSLHPEMYLTIVGMVIESNDAYGIVTISVKDRKVIYASILDAGTEENFSCAGFSNEYNGLRFGCPSLETGGYDSIHNGIDEEKSIRPHPTFTGSPFTIDPTACSELESENKELLEQNLPVVTPHNTPFADFQLIKENHLNTPRFPATAKALIMYHDTNVALDPITLEENISALTKTRDILEFQTAIQAINPEIISFKLEKPTTLPSREEIDRSLLTIYFLKEKTVGGYEIYHLELPNTVASRGRVEIAIQAFKVFFVDGKLRYGVPELENTFDVSLFITTKDATEV